MSPWNIHLPDWVTIDQNTRDPNSPDHIVNCGFAATAAMIRWQTGKHIDPERLREMVGDPVDQNQGSGVEVDQWAYGPNGPGPGRIHIADPQSDRALAWELYNALHGRHPTKVLQWYDERRTEGHWRVVHAGRFNESTGLPEYLSGDPWTGQSVFQTIDELFSLYLGIIVVPLHPRIHQSIGV